MMSSPFGLFRHSARGIGRWNRAVGAASQRVCSSPTTSWRLYSGASMEYRKKVVQDMLYRIRKVNHMPADIRDSLLDFRVDGTSLGMVRPRVVEMLCSYADDKGPVFSVEKDGNGEKYLTLTSQAGTDCDSRTESVDRVMQKLRKDDLLYGWRDEKYPVAPTFYDDPVFCMERTAVSLLGVVEYGVHINGIVVDSKDKSHEGINEERIHHLMWIGRRSPTKSKYPGMLDHLSAGGQPAGSTLEANVEKELWEEAGVPDSVVKAGIQSTGAVSYQFYSQPKDTITRAVLFCYDLDLPESFKPKPLDGEMEEFFLWNVQQLEQSMDPDFPDPFKPNCYVVLVDYLLRRGYISPDTPGYLDILRELRFSDITRG